MVDMTCYDQGCVYHCEGYADLYTREHTIFETQKAIYHIIAVEDMLTQCLICVTSTTV